MTLLIFIIAALVILSSGGDPATVGGAIGLAVVCAGIDGIVRSRSRRREREEAEEVRRQRAEELADGIDAWLSRGSERKPRRAGR